MKAYEEYESLVAKLVKEISPDKQNVIVSYGRKSKMLGKSGQQHQIDVFVKRDDLEVLIECKHWNRRVWPSVVLELFGRVYDIGLVHGFTPPYNSNLRAAIATTKGFSAGAQRLADFFSIEIWHVKSISEAYIKLGNLIAARMSDNANNYRDDVDAVLQTVKPEDS